MGTEEDTFNKLRRVPFNELRLKFLSMGPITHSEKRLIAEEAGWDYQDYMEADYRYWSSKIANYPDWRDIE